MRRKNDKDILKENGLMLPISALFLIVGILLPFLPMLIPTVAYENLTTREITVERVEYVRGYRQHSSGYYCMIAENGEEYRLSGDYRDVDIPAVLYSGREVTVKYRESKIMFRTVKHAEEVRSGRERIVRYDDDEEQPLWVMYLFSGVCILLGAGGICFVSWTVRHNREKQAKRDQKIIKKYGSVKKR